MDELIIHTFWMRNTLAVGCVVAGEGCGQTARIRLLVRADVVRFAHAA